MCTRVCCLSLQLILFQVILEDLPHDFAEALQDYNDQVTSVFSQYLTTVAAELENDRGEENKLPLSGIGNSLVILKSPMLLLQSLACTGFIIMHKAVSSTFTAANWILY